MLLDVVGTATVPGGHRASANRGTGAYSIGVVDQLSTGSGPCSINGAEPMQSLKVQTVYNRLGWFV